MSLTVNPVSANTNTSANTAVETQQANVEAGPAMNRPVSEFDAAMNAMQAPLKPWENAGEALRKNGGKIAVSVGLTALAAEVSARLGLLQPAAEPVAITVLPAAQEQVLPTQARTPADSPFANAAVLSAPSITAQPATQQADLYTTLRALPHNGFAATQVAKTSAFFQNTVVQSALDQVAGTNTYPHFETVTVNVQFKNRVGINETFRVVALNAEKLFEGEPFTSTFLGMKITNFDGTQLTIPKDHLVPTRILDNDYYLVDADTAQLDEFVAGHFEPVVLWPAPNGQS